MVSTVYIVVVFIAIFGTFVLHVHGECSTVPPTVNGADVQVVGNAPFPDDTKFFYQCPAGYSIEGNMIITTCNGSQWTTPSFVCNIILCPLIDPPTNGKIDGDHNYEAGSSITFSCNDGFDISGQSTLNCRIDGGWSPTSVPTCTAKDCGVLDPISNAQTFQETSANGENKYRSEIRVTCNDNYIINGNFIVTCQADGSWSTAPSCDSITCPEYPGLNSSCIKNTLYSNTNLYIVCENSEEASGTKVGGSSTMCGSSGWSDMTIRCYCDCKMNTSVVDVSFQNLNDYGFLPHDTVLSWSCMSGYTENISDAVSCDDGKLVTPSVEITDQGQLCIPHECSTAPPTLDGADVQVVGSAPFPDGTEFIYQCPDGYSISGDTRITKCSGSQWTTPSFTCNIILCPLIDPPTNGKIDGDPEYEVGTSITFSCNDGFDMSGQSSLNCRVDGQWSPTSLPMCTAKDCGIFPPIANAQTFQPTSTNGENKYGSEIRVTCDDNYIINGNFIVTCQANGSWSTVPSCDSITCTEYPGLNSSCIKDTLYSNKNLYIHCENSEEASGTKVGGSSTKCESLGWSDLTMRCYCDCKLNTSVGASFQNLNAYGFLPHDTVLSWSCTSGYTKIISNAMWCDDGKLRIPSGEITDQRQLCSIHPSGRGTGENKGLSAGTIVGVVFGVVVVAGVAGVVVGILWKRGIRPFSRREQGDTETSFTQQYPATQTPPIYLDLHNNQTDPVYTELNPTDPQPTIGTATESV